MHDLFAYKSENNPALANAGIYSILLFQKFRIFHFSFIMGMLKSSVSVADKSDTVRDFPNESAFSSQNAILFNKLRVLIGDLCGVDRHSARWVIIYAF